MPVLPAFIFLKSNASGKFLCYGKNKLKGGSGGGSPTTNLSFSHEINTNLQQQQEEEVATADQLVVEPKRTAGIEPSSGPIDFHMIKFEVEEAKTAPGLVHIRTCYNNKYLIRNSSSTAPILFPYPPQVTQVWRPPFAGGHVWHPPPTTRKCLESESSDSIITAEAHEAEEDQSKSTCTLFKPVFVEETISKEEEDEKEDYVFANKNGFGKPPQKIQLIHVSQFGQHYLGVGNDDNGRVQQLSASAYSDNSLNPTYFTAYDVRANITIPARFTLMGHDDKYISGFSGYNLGFITTDIGGTNVAMEATNPTVPRSQSIWNSISTGARWPWTLNNENGVCLTTGISRTFFTPVKAGNDHIALHASLNRNFVHRVNAGWFDGVSATTMKSIMSPCRLRIGEPVLSRTVSEPYYDLANARIYDTGNFQMYSDSRSNHTSIEQTGTFEVAYVKSHTTTWNQAVTVNIGVTFTMSFRIPFVGSTGVELSASLESTTEWGGSSTEEETIRYTQNVTIPSRKRVILRVLSTRSSCDVPLVCKVRDVMTNGTIREYTKTDILFTGINSYNFDTVLVEEDLP